MLDTFEGAYDIKNLENQMLAKPPLKGAIFDVIWLGSFLSQVGNTIIRFNLFIVMKMIINANNSAITNQNILVLIILSDLITEDKQMTLIMPKPTPSYKKRI